MNRKQKKQKNDDLYPNLEQAHPIPWSLFRSHYCMQHVWRDFGEKVWTFFLHLWNKRVFFL